MHGCGEICGTVVIGRSGPTGAVDPQRPAVKGGEKMYRVGGSTGVFGLS